MEKVTNILTLASSLLPQKFETNSSNKKKTLKKSGANDMRPSHFSPSHQLWLN